MKLQAPSSTIIDHLAGPRIDTDVIVIGAGPSGMSAATEIASSGIGVVVLDMQPAPGGQIFRSLESNFEARPGTDGLLSALGPTYAAGRSLIRRFRGMSGIVYRPRTTVWDLRADGTVGWLKDNAAGYLRARRVVLACGAMERPVPFRGWTLPGVMTAGAVQTLIKAGRLKPEGRIVLAGTGPLIFLLADQLRRLGVRPSLIARTDDFWNKLSATHKLRPSAIPPLLKGVGWLARLRLAGIPMVTGVAGLEAAGRDRVESVKVTVSHRTIEKACDLLVVHDGIVPTIDLAHAAGLALEWQSTHLSWLPVTSPDGQAEMAPGPSLTEGPCRIRITGDARQIGGADAAIAHGRLVAKAILFEFNKKGPPDSSLIEQSFRRAMVARPFIDAAFPPGIASGLPDDQTVVCRCEEITAGALRANIHKSSTDIDLIRGLLRCGMGPCQGRSCSITLARLLDEAGQQVSPQPRPFHARPPVHPLPLGALANLGGIDPELAAVISLDDKPETPVGDANHA